MEEECGMKGNREKGGILNKEGIERSEEDHGINRENREWKKIL